MPRLLEDRELDFIKLLNASPTINSGATFSDGDAVIKSKNHAFDTIRVEIKATDAKSFSIKKETWMKIKKIGFQNNQMPILATDIAGERLVTMDANDFMSLLSLIEVFYDSMDGG